MSAPKVKTGFKIFIGLVIAVAAIFGFKQYADSQPSQVESNNESVQVVIDSTKETAQPVASTNVSTIIANSVAANTIVTTPTVSENPVVAKASNNSDAVKNKKDKVAKVQEPTKKKKKSDDRENLNVTY